MKFGKHLQKRQLEIPEYATSFVNYKALKKLIKHLSATPPILPQNVSSQVEESQDPQAALQANRAAFFFRLERELEKVNAFYLQKEAELKLRLKTLLDKKKMMQGRTNTCSKVSASFVVVEEGFQLFCNDLNKLQQFVEINNTAFSKILKKWDKTSKSRFKELYLSRAVEVQPCFNRDVISDLSDQATTSIQELAAFAEGENTRYEPNRTTEYTVTGQAVSVDNDDIDAQILQAAINSNTSTLQDWITRLLTPTDAKDRFTRIFLAAIPDASETSLALLLSSGLVNIQAEDEVNERNCLHEAAISGNQAALQIGFANKIDVARPDIYGRIPLHYACIMGRVTMVQQLLQLNPRTINEADHDKFTPLIHAIAQDRLDCVEEILKYGACLDPEDESDHVPLNLACQYGRTAIIRLLLEKGAKLLPDTEGLFPQHLVARSGQTPETLLLLKEYGADLDQRDKFYQWTPLFHAASEGQVDCIQVLVNQGVDTTILDEKGCSAMYYAAWEGHLDCMRLLNLEEESAAEPQPRVRRTSPFPPPEDMIPESVGGDGIPDLSLPPPIIPLRRYGHNFLDNKTFIQLSFETTGSDAIVFYHDSKYPAARLTISSKSSDVIPRNIMLPIQEDARVVPFQIDNLSSFSIDFDIYPTFGSKVIARSVALPALFTARAHSSGSCCLPLIDLRLRPIGQISFAFQVIKPFNSMPLDVTTFATYWRATSQIDNHPTGLITGSSLSGNYVQLFVQVTSDGVPVLYSRWCVDHQGLEVPISKLRYAQYSSLGLRRIDQDELLAHIAHKTPEDHVEVHKLLASSLASLRDVLSNLPTSIHLDIRVLFPTAIQEHELGLSPSPNINSFVDAILREVFEHTQMTTEQKPDFVRSIVFSSYNPDICTALNWKQPNYPVLLCNGLEVMGEPQAVHEASPSFSVASNGQQSMSVKEMVRIAQSTNFMGLVCSSWLLKMVPSLIESIKVAGLVLVMDTSQESYQGAHGDDRYQMPEGVDGILRGNGVLRFNETIDM